MLRTTVGIPLEREKKKVKRPGGSLLGEVEEVQDIVRGRRSRGVPLEENVYGESAGTRREKEREVGTARLDSADDRAIEREPGGCRSPLSSRTRCQLSGASLIRTGRSGPGLRDGSAATEGETVNASSTPLAAQAVHGLHYA